MRSYFHTFDKNIVEALELTERTILLINPRRGKQEEL